MRVIIVNSGIIFLDGERGHCGKYRRLKNPEITNTLKRNRANISDLKSSPDV